ncbi:PREDICTED: uncharacterized protein LOC106128454 [Papilio xuthus]|uniref:Target of rapamycin complex subunit lst8 n=1 Tax=Papilio xuthus TaxID=66420 RepID=A0AAJ6ZZ20_PAPXU|nr:PREDICTED: uncharacterized protein LOC106128454 [Papilio xuthus]
MSALKIEAEVKVESEPCVVAWDNNTLFVGTETGAIFSYDKNLSPGEKWTAHETQVFALTAANGNVYSSSNDGGVRVWSATGVKVAELPPTGGDIGALCVHNNQLIAGDESGNVVIYENNDVKAKYQVLEEVKDICLKPPYMFTARDLYVTVTEIKPEESKTRFTTRHTMEGRAPLRVSGARLVVTARGANNLQLHDASIDTKFKKLHEVKVSDMIITSLSVSEDHVWTGGWDGIVRRWKIAGDQFQPAGEINLGACVNALVATKSDVAYAIITGGRAVCLKGA